MINSGAINNSATIDALNDVNTSLTNSINNVNTTLTNSINTKQANITGGASSITTSNLTANRALISNGSGKVAVSSVTSTELGYLDGVTSAIQTQLNGKVSTSKPYVTTTWNDGTKWYRVWSDGWIEQGGITNIGANVSFPRQFNNTPLTMSLTFYKDESTHALDVNTVTNTYFYAHRHTGGTQQCYWYACGY